MQPTCQLYPAHLPACPPACPHVIEHPPLPCPIVLLQVEQYSRRSALGAKLEQKAVKLHLLPCWMSRFAGRCRTLLLCPLTSTA